MRDHLSPILIILLVLIVPIYAKGNSWHVVLWENYSGRVTDIIVYDGYVFAVGSYSVGDNERVFIAKFTLDGQVVWNRTINISRFEYNPLLIAHGDALYMTFNTMNYPTEDIVIVRMALNGSIEWSRNLNLNLTDVVGLAEYNGYLYVLGTKVEDTFNGQAMLIALDSKGNIVHSRYFSIRKSRTWAQSITAYGGYVYIGILVTDYLKKPKSFYIYALNATNISDMAVYSSIDMDGDEKAIRLSAGKDGVYVLARSYIESSDKNLYYLLKYSYNLKELWRKTNYEAKEMIFRDIHAYEGNIYLVGDNSTSWGDRVVFRAYDDKGIHLWTSEADCEHSDGYTLYVYGDTIYYGGSASKKTYYSPCVGAYPISQGKASYLIELLFIIGVVVIAALYKIIKRKKREDQLQSPSNKADNLSI